MSADFSRRAALGALASAPALALPAALAATGPTLVALIEAHRVAKAAFHVEIDALEAAEPDPSIRIPCFGLEPLPVAHGLEGLRKQVHAFFEREGEWLAHFAQLAPELVEPGRAALEKEKAAVHERLDEVFAGFIAALARYRAACQAEEDALTAICAHRCASFAELEDKGRFLVRHIEHDELTEGQQTALLRSFLPEGKRDMLDMPSHSRRPRPLVDPAPVPLVEPTGLSAIAFSGVCPRVIGELTHLMFYIAQPASDGDIEYVIVARMTAPTATALATAETISATIAQPQMALNPPSSHAN